MNFYKKIKKNFDGIYKACNYSFFYSCGSYLINGKKYKYDKKMLNKQLLLYKISKKANHILEIGVYMGHSILIMLTANPKLNIIGVDIDDRFAPKSIKYLAKNFPNSKLKFIQGDSLIILKKLKKKFDLFHIDGDHKPKKIYQEILACISLSKSNNMKILFDDAEMMRCVDKALIKSFKINKKISPVSKFRNLYLEIVLNKVSIIKFKIYFHLFYFLDFPFIVLVPFMNSLIRKSLIIFLGKKICNNLGIWILHNFKNIYFINFAKKLKNI